MNSTIKDLLNRRSIRKFTDEPVSEDDLNLILEAGLYAPSGSNKQTAIMVVVQDPETVRYLERLNASVVGKDPETAHNFYGASTVIVVLAQKEAGNRAYDGSLVMGNLMNAAAALGLGSCWINRARETFETEEGKKLLEKWGIEGEWEGVGNCILGHIAGEYPEAAPRRENRVYRVR